jgi:hypothetical protein
MATKPKTVNPQVEVTDEDKDRIGTLDSVLATPEIEVGAVENVPVKRGERTVVIRVNDNIEQMSIVAGGRRREYTFEVGKQYRVPVQVAIMLEDIGKVWH